MEPQKILLYPLMGEKATMLREKGNQLTFIVSRKATKTEVAQAVEQLYSVKVKSVKTLLTTDGKKKAHIALKENFSADEVASQFGVL